MHARDVQSGANFLQPAGRGRADRQENGGSERAKMNHSIGNRAHDDDAKRQVGNVLLKFNIAIQSNEYVATLPGAPHQFAIEYATPATLHDRTDVVTGQL